MNVPHHSGKRCIGFALVAATGAGLCLACAAHQRVPLDCVPEQVTVYVDQEALEKIPEALELRADRPHKIFLKGPDYEPRLVVLEPRLDASGRTTLYPERICVELVPVGIDRRLELEVEEDGGASPGVSDPDGAKP